MVPVLILYICLVGGLLWTELMQKRNAQLIFKPAAALGFIIIALLIGVPDGLYGQLVLLGLIACAFGFML